MTRDYSDTEYEAVLKQTDQISRQFHASPQFSGMFKYCQQEARYVIEKLGDLAYNYGLFTPAEWSLGVFLGQVYNIQRKCMFHKSFFKALPKVIYHFSKYCAINSIGKFDLEAIEDYKHDLKDGVYEDTFYSNWDEGHEDRMQAYDSLFR